MLPGCWLPSILPAFCSNSSSKTTLSPLIWHVLSAAMWVNQASQQRTHIDPRSCFFILEIALIASNRVPQSRFITRILTLLENHHLAGLTHQPLNHQKCFHSLLEYSIMRKHDSGEVAHMSTHCTLTLQNNCSDFLWCGCTFWHCLLSVFVEVSRLSWG